MPADESSIEASSSGPACVLVSGGVDSAACVQLLKSQGFAVTALHIDYGQLAASDERRAAECVCKYYGVPIHFASWTGIQGRGAGEVVGRNAFFIFAALMELPQDGLLVLGVHSGTPYFDCSSDFLSSVQGLLNGYSNGRVQIVAPFLHWDKRQIWELCIERGVPLEVTYSCERGGTPPCGTCLSCKDRKALDALANVNDSA